MGADALRGHSVSDSIQGATAFVPIDMRAWGRGVEPIPVFAPQKARCLRFIVKKRRLLNGKPVAARVRELRVYAESPAQVEQSMTRKFSLDASTAELTFRAEVRNYDDKSVEVTVGCVIAQGNISFERRMTLEALETRSIAIGGIVLDKPHLWWPNTYGEQFLYTAEAYVRDGGADSDVKRFRFGVRQFSYPVDGGLLRLYCNGTRIVAKGGNWGLDDALKCDMPEDYYNKVRLHQEANLTMIRNWIGMTHPAEGI